MEIFFTEQEIAQKENIIEIEDIVLTGNSIEIFEGYYVIKGNALIDGETFLDFLVEFTLTSEPTENTTKSILSIEWDEYDFIF